MTSRKATGNPRSSFAHQMAPSTIDAEAQELEDDEDQVVREYPRVGGD